MTTEKLDSKTKSALSCYLLRLGDDALVLGHRLSEWCGHGPILEEDIALSNLALDCIGQSSNLLRLAGEVEGKGRSEDSFAYFRDAVEFRNCLLVEQPNGDFAFTIVRQFLFNAYCYFLYERLQTSSYEPLAAIACKSIKEVRYHLRHSGEWIVRLGDGTDESHQRVQTAVDDLWRFVGELFVCDDVVSPLVKKSIAVDPTELKPKWDKMVRDIFLRATLKIPGESTLFLQTGREGFHSEHLGHMLAQMQIVARSHPDATW